MTRIVQFKDRRGGYVGVNPEHVAYCAQAMQNGAPVIGCTALQLAQPTVTKDGLTTTIIVVEGSVEDTVERLNHGEAAN